MKAVVLLLFATNVFASSKNPLIQIVFNVDSKDRHQQSPPIVDADDIISLDDNNTVVIEDFSKVKLDPEKVIKALLNYTDDEIIENNRQSVTLLDFIREMFEMDIDNYLKPKNESNLTQITREITPEEYKLLRTRLDEEIELDSEERDDLLGPSRRYGNVKNKAKNLLKGLTGKISIKKSESSTDETENSEESFSISSRNGIFDAETVKVLERLLNNIKSKGADNNKFSPNRRSGKITINRESTKLTSSENKKDSLNVDMDSNELTSDLVKLIEKVMSSDKVVNKTLKVSNNPGDDSPDYRRSYQEPDAHELSIKLSYKKNGDSPADILDIDNSNKIVHDPTNRSKNIEIIESPIKSDGVVKNESRLLVPEIIEPERKENGAKHNLKDYLKQLIAKIRKELQEIKSKLTDGREHHDDISIMVQDVVKYIGKELLKDPYESKNDILETNTQKPKIGGDEWRRAGVIDEPVNKGKPIIKTNNVKNNDRLKTANEEFNAFVANDLPVLYVNTISDILAKEQPKKELRTPPKVPTETEIKKELTVENPNESDDLELDNEFLRRLELAKNLKNKKGN